MGKTLRQKRDELNKAFYDLLAHSNNEVIDHEYETDEEWGFIECTNDKGQELKFVFTDRETVEFYIDGIQQIGIK